MRVKEYNQEVSRRYNYLSLDIDGNAFGDVNYTTNYVKDMALPGNKLKFYGGGSSMISFPVKFTDNGQETLILKKGDWIGAKSFSAIYPWLSSPFIAMAIKSEPDFNQPVSWEGQWKNLSHVYQGFRLSYPTGDLFYGWVELSLDTSAENLIIHAAGVSTEPGRAVRAGYR